MDYINYMKLEESESRTYFYFRCQKSSVSHYCEQPIKIVAEKYIK